MAAFLKPLLFLSFLFSNEFCHVFSSFFEVPVVNHFDHQSSILILFFALSNILLSVKSSRRLLVAHLHCYPFTPVYNQPATKAWPWICWLCGSLEYCLQTKKHGFESTLVVLVRGGCNPQCENITIHWPLTTVSWLFVKLKYKIKKP